MKLKYLYLAIVASCSGFLSSCSDNHKEAMVPIKLDVSQNSFNFTVAPTEETLDLTSEADWKITVDQGGNWLTVSPLEGTGNTTLNLSAIRNVGAARSAVITIAARGAELRTVKVTQDPYKGYLYGYADATGLGWTGGVGTFIDCQECADGKALKITTKAGTADRIKASTSTQFGSGRYEWRVYISDLGMNDRASIAGFLYADDTHELDFEIGSGTAAARAAAGAKADEVLCYATSQANPWVQKVKPIKKNAWHIIVLDMKLVNGKYLAEWLVDGTSLALQQMNFGEEYPFHVFSSVENLGFIGDHAPVKDSYGLFDYMEYLPYEYSMKPITDEANNDPEPEGTTTTWNFNDGNIPDVWKNFGGTVTDGWLILTNGKSMNYEEPVGAGKYTWRIRIPAVGKNEKMVMGGNLYAAVGGGEQSFSMFTLYGTDGQRATCTPAPNSSQMLIRCYTEAGEYFIPVDPETIHTFTIDIRIKDNKYTASWLLDGDVVRSVNTRYDPALIKFSLSTNSFADGGAWQGTVPTTKTYEAKYDFIEYKKYNYE